MTTAVKPVAPYQLCYFGAIHTDPAVAVDVPDGHASYWYGHGWCTVVGSIGADVNEVQRVAITGNPGSGTWTLAFNGSDPSAPIDNNPGAGEVQRALEGLSTIGPGNVVVSRPLGWTFEVTFINELGGTNVPLLVADDTGLPGAAAVTVTTVTQGSGSTRAAKKTKTHE